MTRFEIIYSLCSPFLPAIHHMARKQQMRLVDECGLTMPDILDVGGRKSHCTIGVKGNVVVSDIPRQSDIQKQLHLGVTDEIISQTLSRRSNVEAFVIDDMTVTGFDAERFDFVFAVEVLEHVENDEDFVRNVNRVLRSGGTFYMTTPNGDHVANNNPDHARHYTKHGLRRLLMRHFRTVDVAYRIMDSRYHTIGGHPFKIRYPIRSARAMVANRLNYLQSKDVDRVESHHLVAIATKNGLRSASPGIAQ